MPETQPDRKVTRRAQDPHRLALPRRGHDPGRGGAGGRARTAPACCASSPPPAATAPCRSASPPALRCVELERALEANWGLDRAIVVPEPQAPERIPGMIGQELGALVSQTVRSGMTIGLGWGKTLSTGLASIEPREPDGVRVISMLGGLTRVSSTNPSEFAWRVADRLSAECHLMAAPVFAPSRATRDALVGHPGISEIFDRAVEPRPRDRLGGRDDAAFDLRRVRPAHRRGGRFPRAGGCGRRRAMPLRRRRGSGHRPSRQRAGGGAASLRAATGPQRRAGVGRLEQARGVAGGAAVAAPERADHQRKGRGAARRRPPAVGRGGVSLVSQRRLSRDPRLPPGPLPSAHR